MEPLLIHTQPDMSQSAIDRSSPVSEMDEKHQATDEGDDDDETDVEGGEPSESPPVVRTSLRQFAGGDELPDQIGGIPTDHAVWSQVIQLAETPRLWRDPPRRAWEHLQLYAEPICKRFIEADDKGDTGARERALI
jgi:hypothetical protein